MLNKKWSNIIKVLKRLYIKLFGRWKKFFNTYINEEKEFILFWNPKCASTSLVQWFIKSLNLKNDHKSIRSRKNLNEYGYYHKIMQNKHKKMSKFTKIIFIRNPYTRIVSAFVDKFVFRKKINGFDKIDPLEKMQPHAKSVVLKIYQNKGLNPQEYKGITFVDFINYIEYTMNQKKPQLNHHWAPQTDGSIKFDKICKIEEMSKCIDQLNKRYNISNFKLEKLNTGYYNNEAAYSSEKLYTKTTIEISKLDTKYNHKNFYNDDLKKRIKEIYTKDIDLGKYTYE